MNYIYFKIPNVKTENIHNIYNFLEFLKDTDIYIYYNILNNLDIYVLKNLWNNIVKEWSKSINYMKKNKNDNLEKYTTKSYKIIHHVIYHQDLNDYLNDFVDRDEFRAIFIFNCILKHT
jgi:hypothetical protein